MIKKMSSLPRVIIGKRLPVDTLKLQQGSPLRGLDQEVPTLGMGTRGGGAVASPLDSPNVWLLEIALPSAPRRSGSARVG